MVKPELRIICILSTIYEKLKAPKAGVRSQLPGSHSFSALSVANIHQKSAASKQRCGFFHTSVKRLYIGALFWHVGLTIDCSLGADRVYRMKHSDGLIIDRPYLTET